MEALWTQKKEEIDAYTRKGLELAAGVREEMIALGQQEGLAVVEALRFHLEAIRNANMEPEKETRAVLLGRAQIGLEKSLLAFRCVLECIELERVLGITGEEVLH